MALTLKNPQTQETRYIGDPDINTGLIANLKSQGFTETVGGVPGPEFKNAADALASLDPITGKRLNPVASQPFVTPGTTPSSPVTVPELVATKPEEQATDVSKRIQELNDLIAGKSAFETEQQTKFGIETKTATQKSLYNLLLNLKAFTENIPAQIQAQSEGRGRTVGGIEPLQAGELRKAGIQATILNAQYQAATGDLATAESLVERAVKGKFAPYEAERNAKLANLKLIQDSPDYSLADKNRANAREAKIKQRDAQVAEAKKATEDILKLGNDLAASENPDQMALKRIRNLVEDDKALTATPEDVAIAQSIAAPFLKKKEKAPSLGSDFELYKLFATQRNEPVTQEGYLKYRASEAAAGRVGGGEGGTRELQTAAFAKARPVLEASKKSNGFVDPKVYIKLRNDYVQVIGEAKNFDDIFSPLLNPQDRINLGIQSAVAQTTLETPPFEPIPAPTITKRWWEFWKD